MNAGEVDPRVRARRIHVRRSIGRRRFRILLVLGAPVATAGVALAALWSPLFAVRDVAVNASGSLDVAAIRAATGIHSGSALVSIDTKAVAERVEQLPTVGSVVVNREWPGTVRLRVQGRRPSVAVKAGDGTWRSVDLTGRILTQSDGPTDLPVVDGPVAAGDPGAYLPAQAAGAVRAAATMPSSVRALVQEVKWDAQGNTRLTLKSGVMVDLGSADALSQQYISLVTLLNKIGMTPVASIDVRVPNAPVVTAIPPPASTNTPVKGTKAADRTRSARGGVSQ